MIGPRRPVRPAALLSLALAAPLPANATHVGDCGTWQANARNVDWSDPTRTYAQGAIRLTGLDTGEPASASFHIMVTFPLPDGPGADCRLISADEGRLGFGSISLRRATAEYDARRGLTVTVPGATGMGDPILIVFTVDQRAGTVILP